MTQKACTCFSCYSTFMGQPNLPFVFWSSNSPFCQILACSFPSSAASNCLQLLQLLTHSGCTCCSSCSAKYFGLTHSKSRFYQILACSFSSSAASNCLHLLQLLCNEPWIQMPVDSSTTLNPCNLLLPTVCTCFSCSKLFELASVALQNTLVQLLCKALWSCKLQRSVVPNPYQQLPFICCLHLL